MSVHSRSLGKTAVVTGGSGHRRIYQRALCCGRGEGRHWRTSRFRRMSTAPIRSRSESKLRAEHASRLEADITSAEQMESLTRVCEKDLSGVDILVNSAGFTRTAGMEQLSVEAWRQSIDVNLSGAFVATRAVVPQMLRRGGGRIIYIGSAGSITGGGGSAAYSAAKAGINGLVRALSRELRRRGSR